MLRRLSAVASLRQHWPEYLMEAAALGLFMISAGACTALLESPHSAVHGLISSPALRRGLIGLAMGGTAMGLIYSPWGKRSGAHMNPSVTLAFLRLGKIPAWDALFYILFQFAGGLAGVLLATAVLGGNFTLPPVDYVVTIPGPAGMAAAFGGELVIAFAMMGVILWMSQRRGLARFTGLIAGLLIASFVEFESPLSGFGMNPARTFASALPSGIWTAIGLYFTAAPLGMLLAAQRYRAPERARAIQCCKLHHDSRHRCIFCGERVVSAFSAK